MINKKVNLREKDKRGKIMIAILLLIAIIGVGYAALGANLKINGVANIPSASWDVHFKTGSINVTNGSVTIDTSNNEQAATITSLTQVDYAVKLALPGDFYEFTVKAENTGSIDAMIDSVVSKRGDTVITTGTLPSYIDYSVTYSDGVTISPKQILAASTEETYKVRIAYKTDIEASELPSEAVTLNLNFQINYVQADSTAVAVSHPFTGTMYGVYGGVNPVSNDNIIKINQTVPSTVSLRLTQNEAITDWERLTGISNDTKNFYLSHTIENDVVKETYLGLIVTPEMAEENPGMIAGTYSIKGGYSYSDNTSIHDAMNTMYEIFDYNNHQSRCARSDVGDVCTASGIQVTIYSLAINIKDDSWECIIYASQYDGKSYCFRINN